LAVAGLTLGFLLWQVGFMSIAANGSACGCRSNGTACPSAFRFVVTIAAVLIFVALPDENLD